MVEFTCHSVQTAPEAARSSLEQAAREMGGDLPNIYRYMAESPELLDGYRQLRNQLTKTKLTSVEQELVQLVISFEHGCTYCMAGHSMRAKMIRMDADTIAALRAGTAITDPRLAALAAFTRQMVLTRGHASETEIEAFLAAGYTRQNALEVVLAIAAKVLTNYANHLFETPLNDFLKPFAWTKPE